MQSVQKAYSPTKGNHLVAKKDIKLGDLILEEPPFEAVLYEEPVGRHDHYSFKHGERGELQRCGKCKFARFHLQIRLQYSTTVEK